MCVWGGSHRNPMMNQKTGFKGGLLFSTVEFPFWTKMVEDRCISRMITTVCAFESLLPEVTSTYTVAEMW